jgi:hypothetical protein
MGAPGLGSGRGSEIGEDGHQAVWREEQREQEKDLWENDEALPHPGYWS